MPPPASAPGPDGAGWGASRRSRSRAAAGRLETARRRFECSLITLRRVALDAVDSGDLASLTLRVCGEGRRHTSREGTA